MISGVLFSVALFSFTLLLYDFHKGEVGIGKKYAELAYFSAISGNSGIQKGDGSTVTGKRTPILMLLAYYDVTLASRGLEELPDRSFLFFLTLFYFILLALTHTCR